MSSPEVLIADLIGALNDAPDLGIKLYHPYNKEKLRGAVEVMLEQPDLLFNDIWSKMKEEEMQEAPKDWIPKDDKLKIEGE